VSTTVVYGFGPNPDELYVVTEAGLDELAHRMDVWGLVANATWEEIRESLSGPDDPLYPDVRTLLDSELRNAYDDLVGSDSPEDPPNDWWPPEERPDDSFTPDVPIPRDSDVGIDTMPSLATFDDPDLPPEIAAFGKRWSSMMGGDGVNYSPEDLPAMGQTAKRLGVELRHDQAEIDRCRGDLRFW
jgi:hypothetical protein